MVRFDDAQMASRRHLAITELELVMEEGGEGREERDGIRVGDKVEARYCGWSHFYPGRVTSINDDGTYDIFYDPLLKVPTLCVDGTAPHFRQHHKDEKWLQNGPNTEGGIDFFSLLLKINLKLLSRHIPRPFIPAVKPVDYGIVHGKPLYGAVVEGVMSSRRYRLTDGLAAILRTVKRHGAGAARLVVPRHTLATMLFECEGVFTTSKENGLIQLVAGALAELSPGRVSVLLFRPDSVISQKYPRLAFVLEDPIVRKVILNKCPERLCSQTIFRLSPQSFTLIFFELQGQYEVQAGWAELVKEAPYILLRGAEGKKEIATRIRDLVRQAVEWTPKAFLRERILLDNPLAQLDPEFWGSDKETHNKLGVHNWAKDSFRIKDDEILALPGVVDGDGKFSGKDSDIILKTFLIVLPGALTQIVCDAAALHEINWAQKFSKALATFDKVSVGNYPSGGPVGAQWGPSGGPVGVRGEEGCGLRVECEQPARYRRPPHTHARPRDFTGPAHTSTLPTPTFDPRP